MSEDATNQSLGEWKHYRQKWGIAVGQKFRCKYCNVNLLKTEQMFAGSQWDHFVPINRGGTDIDNNLYLVCQFCNSQKGKRYFDSLEKCKHELEKERKDYLERWRYYELKQQFGTK